MIIESTLSFHMGSRFNEKHNNRTIPVPHACAEYEKKHNWYSPNNISLEQAYDKLFSESFDEYNSSVRNDRKYNSYLEKLQIAQQKEQEKIAELRHRGASTSEIRKFRKAVKPAYELIIGCGSMRNNPEFCMNGNMQNTVKQILQDYVEQFEKNNPNVCLYNTAIHTGENGVIHLHADVIFWAECSRGQKKQASLTKALSAMGYNSDKEKGANGKRVNAITKWEMAQREILKNLCLQRGIIIKEGKHSQKHLETKQFQIQSDNEFIDEQAKQLLAMQDSFIDCVQNSNSAVAYLEHLENNELRKTVSEYEKIKQRSETVLSESWSEFNNATSDYFEQYRRKKKMLFDEIQRARKDANHSRKRLKSILNNIAYSNDFFIIKMFKLVFALFIAIETKSLEQDVQELQKRNQEIKAQAKQIIADGQTIGDKLRNKDLDMIEQVLTEYENQLEQSLQNINDISITRYKEETIQFR